jgi:hypothetical protein
VLGQGTGNHVVVAVLFIAVFLAVVIGFVLTEYLFELFDARGRVMVGGGFALPLIVGVNLTSFLLVLLSSYIFVFASGTSLYGETALVCLGGQGVWLCQHLWFYYRDHLRLHHEN